MRAKILAIALGAIVSFGAVFALTTTLWKYGVDGPLTNAVDFRAFYCAGSALDAGGDPYRVEPVRSCERDSLRVAGFSFAEKDVLVTPYPPLEIAALGVLARLPYRTAAEIWMSLNIVALCTSIVLVARLAAIRPLYAALALAASVGFASLFLGQPLPIAVVGLVIAALGARADRGWVVALGLVLTSVQPQLALPAWIAAYVALPIVRRPIVIVAAIALCASVFVSVPLFVEYARDVLPSHARSEIANFTDQYGLSPLLRHLGMPIPWALRLGSLSYVAMAALGVWLGSRLRTIFADAAFVVLTPAAFAIVGGPFVHGHQIAIAMPFAVLLLARARPSLGFPARAALCAAIVLLAIPWHVVADEPGVNGFFPHQAYVRPAPFRVPEASEYIDRSYTEREDALEHTNERTPAMQLAWKLPTWAALVTIVVIALSLVPSSPHRARIRLRSASGGVR